MAKEEIVKPEITKVSVKKATVEDNDIIVPQGQVLLVSLDIEGNEIQGTEFFYPEKSYKRFYGDSKKFKVKKKAKK